MRGLIRTLYAYWQPVAVIGGALTSITGATGTTAVYLGPWPAATVGGALTALAALRWANYTTVREEPETR
jgi:hypothetical protein